MRSARLRSGPCSICTRNGIPRSIQFWTRWVGCLPVSFSSSATLLGPPKALMILGASIHPLHTMFTDLSTPGLSTRRLTSDNGGMHESMVRLINYARDVTAHEKPPVLTWGDVGVRMDVSPAVLTNWKARGISEGGAIRAEKVFGCSVSWLMTGATAKEAARPGAIAIPSFGGTDVLLQPSTFAPEIAWADVERVITMSNDKPAVIGAAVRWERVHQAGIGNRAKFVKVPDHALAGRCEQGELLLIDPDSPAAPGKVVLVRDRSGALYLRQYRQLGAAAWEATSTRPDDFGTIPGAQLEILGRAVQLVSLEP